VAAGVYAFGPSGVVIPLQNRPWRGVSLLFFHNNHDLALATASRATTHRRRRRGYANVRAVTITPRSRYRRRAIAASFDNRVVVMADGAGTLVNLSNATAVELRLFAHRARRLGGRCSIERAWTQ